MSRHHNQDHPLTALHLNYLPFSTLTALTRKSSPRYLQNQPTKTVRCPLKTKNKNEDSTGPPKNTRSGPTTAQFKSLLITPLKKVVMGLINTLLNRQLRKCSGPLKSPPTDPP